MSRFRNPPPKSEIATRLKAVRLSRGLSQEDFASQTGLSVHTYRFYEQGRRELPGHLYFRIFQLFDVDPNWLYDASGKGPETAPMKQGESPRSETSSIPGKRVSVADAVSTYIKTTRYPRLEVIAELLGLSKT